MSPTYVDAEKAALRKADEENENGKGDERIWEIRDMPGKGKGLVAIKDITPGTLIISESPLLTTEGISSSDPEASEAHLATSFSSLSLKQQDAYMALHNNHSETDPKRPLSGIMKSNGYPMGGGHGGVCEIIARINHACNPNGVQFWNELREELTVYAMRPIPSGTEITTSYLMGGTSSERKSNLKDQFGFECACELCSLPKEKREQSDTRLRRAQELDALIGDERTPYEEPDRVLKACKELFDIYELESIKDGRVSRLYYDAFQTCNLHSDLARARCFVKYYCDAKQMAEGKDSINVLEERRYIKDPRKHGSFGGEKGIWRTDTKDVPRGLGRKDFARWLWREDV